MLGTSSNSQFYTQIFTMDLKDMMSRMDTMNATTEQLVNSITITEGPVQNMSLAVGKTSRTPYSDATKVSVMMLPLNVQFLFCPVLFPGSLIPSS